MITEELIILVEVRSQVDLLPFVQRSLAKREIALAITVAAALLEVALLLTIEAVAPLKVVGADQAAVAVVVPELQRVAKVLGADNFSVL